jgi:hypothetical protein
VTFILDFYRTRDRDDAHALVGREIVEASGLDEAIVWARQLARTLDMPQVPDALSVSDGEGRVLHIDSVDLENAEPSQRSADHDA